MIKVKVFGAGSIGNHLTHACRSIGWQVSVCDVDRNALARMKAEIYPSRYGSWDDSIVLGTPNDLPSGGFDVVIIGTPPDIHIRLALDAIEGGKPSLLLIEKPLCTPDLAGAQQLYEAATRSSTKVFVGYNHVVGKSALETESLIDKGLIGDFAGLQAGFLEHWGGIFKAHPWLSGPKDSYLGYSHRGGGASGEHSHALHLWQHFAHKLSLGRVNEVYALMDFVNGSVHYDRTCHFNVRTDKGVCGLVTQDVITEPSRKFVRIQGSKGFVEWQANGAAEGDTVTWRGDSQDQQRLVIAKRRPDDFRWEIEHLAQTLAGEAKPSPISLERGLDTMMVIAAAHRSHQERRPMRIEYGAGYVAEAIKPV